MRVIKRTYKWQRNSEGGVTLLLWQRGEPLMHNGKQIWAGFEGWRGYADVFKAKKGSRWIVRWRTNAGYQQGVTLTLREAMRLARAMAGINHGN